jgi:hypothetical protein
MLSACANCQGRNYIRWSAYNANCTTVYSQVFAQPIPIGLKVPAWAYQEVDTSDNFNITSAQSTKGPESTRISSGAPGPTNTSPPTGGAKKTNVGAIAGGVVGGVVALGIIACLIFFFVIRKKKQEPVPKPAYEPVLPPQTPMTHTDHSFTGTGGAGSQYPLAMSPPPPGISPPLPGMSPPPGAPGRIYDPNDPSTFPVLEQHTGGYNPYPGTPEPQMHQSPYAQNVTQHYTGNSQQHATPPPPSRPTYTGAPEL